VDGVCFRKLDVFNDRRGWLTEIFRADETDFSPAMSYVSMTKSGVARGPHEHIEQSDYFCFFGDFRLFLWDNRKKSASFGEKMVLDTEGNPHIAIVPPGVVHAYKNVGTADAFVVNLPDRLFKGERKAFPVDEVRYEDDPDSPFRIE
jgi:dTDP-4-dehydrorhamnose 3,5-epimerase